MNWYLLQTKPHAHKTARDHLMRQGFDVFRPLIVKTTKKSGKFLDVKTYKNVLRWAREINYRQAVKRGIMVNKIKGNPSSQLHERHSSSDFIHKTQDKLEK